MGSSFSVAVCFWTFLIHFGLPSVRERVSHSQQKWQNCRFPHPYFQRFRLIIISKWREKCFKNLFFTWFLFVSIVWGCLNFETWNGLQMWTVDVTILENSPALPTRRGASRFQLAVLLATRHREVFCFTELSQWSFMSISPHSTAFICISINSVITDFVWKQVNPQDKNNNWTVFCVQETVFLPASAPV
jgi:hypothetical protein